MVVLRPDFQCSSFRLQVLLFPLQASRTGFGEEPDLAFPVDYLPLLRVVVEFNSAGPGDFELAKLM
jgi:hypothetical protein